MITANESALSGDASIQLADTPKIMVNLVAEKLDLDNLLGTVPSSTRIESEVNNNRVGVKPVISGANPQQYDLSGLQVFSANINLAINQLIYRGMMVSDVVLRHKTKHLV